MRALAALVLVLAGPALADPPPTRPPDARDPTPLDAGETWVAPPGGGVCMDDGMTNFVVQKERYLLARAGAAEKVAEGEFLRGGAWGVVVGVGVGLVAGVFIAGKVAK